MNINDAKNQATASLSATSQWYLWLLKFHEEFANTNNRIKSAKKLLTGFILDNATEEQKEKLEEIRALLVEGNINVTNAEAS